MSLNARGPLKAFIRNDLGTAAPACCAAVGTKRLNTAFPIGSPYNRIAAGHGKAGRGRARHGRHGTPLSRAGFLTHAANPLPAVSRFYKCRVSV